MWLARQSEIPPKLQAQAEAFLERLPTDLSLSEEVALSLPKVFALSHFVAGQCVRHPQWLTWEGLRQPEQSYRSKLRAFLDGATDLSTFSQKLRWFRNREMVRIAWRDLAGWAGLEETLRDLTALAEVLIDEALHWLFARFCERYGTPQDRFGRPQNLVVIGMGKLGGGELNFSSDVDLIFAYEEEGRLKGLSYQEFYHRLAQALMKALHQRTEDGFVYRVDIRLRPFGDSGPLVMNFEAMESYYEAYGRDWERYAWIKARPVAGDIEAGNRLLERLLPFVYRRYLDYAALEALRELKEKIMREVRRRELYDDIKRGPGGIRELEFMVQLFQLIYGGREQRLRVRGFKQALSALMELALISSDEGEAIGHHYDFLRIVENRLQEESDEQTQRLPRDEIGRLKLAFGMDFPNWSVFEEELNKRRCWIQQRFEQLLAAPEERSDEILALFEGNLSSEEARRKLVELGYRHPEEVLQRLWAFRQSRRFHLIGPRGEKALYRFLPHLLREVAREPEDERPQARFGEEETGVCFGRSAEVHLKRLLDLLEALAGRSVYYMLLAEQPEIVGQLARLATSPLIMRILSQSPILLDELIDPRTLYVPLDREALRHELEEKLEAIDWHDEEALFEQLRLFKNTQLLKIAAADLVGAIHRLASACSDERHRLASACTYPTSVVSDYLTWLAEAILEKALTKAWHHVAERYGLPPDAVKDEVSDFAILGYGKLGSRELNYTSDLDLVFIYRGDPTAMTRGAHPLPLQQFYLRLAHRLIALLTTQTAAGKVYEIDTQLRPSGRAGLLVSSWEAYARYQREEAWTWEQQALIRARWVAGDRSFEEPFRALRREILSRRRAPERLAREMVEMREKMIKHLDRSSGELFDLKQGRGGLVDLEFVVQFENLLNAHRAPDRFDEGSLCSLIEGLAALQVLTPKEAEISKEVALTYRTLLHRLALEGKPPQVPASQVAREREAVQRLWQNHVERHLNG